MSTSTADRLPEMPGHGFADDVEFLAAYSQFFAVSRDLDATLETALSGIAQGLRADSGALFLLDAAEGDLVCRAAIGSRHRPGERASPDDGVLGRCLRRNAVETAPGADAGGTAGHVLCAPLAADGRPFGVLQVTSGRASPPFTTRDTFLLQTMANSAALAVANARMAGELVRQEVMEQEIRLAAEIQRSLLPRAGQTDLPICGFNRPVRMVSGDFFDYFVLPDRRIPFALGDVSGKGINAALLMSKAASLFRCLGKRSDDPALILSIINREIHETSSRGMFVTMVAGTFDPATGRLRFANAGHEPPLLRKRDRSYQTFPAEAPPLGIIPDMQYWISEVDLDGGEFYIFSDGLVEFQYGDDEELGVNGLIQLIEGLADLPLGERLPALLDALDREGWELRDDLTVLAIGGEMVRAYD
jgi:sigma-B regulation protein RsbU (phosphoserine phosphatase)